MNRGLQSLLLWAGWFLASADICALLRIAAELMSARALTALVAMNFATALIGVIALVVTLDIASAYSGERPA